MYTTHTHKQTNTILFIRSRLPRANDFRSPSGHLKEPPEKVLLLFRAVLGIVSLGLDLSVLLVEFLAQVEASVGEGDIDARECRRGGIQGSHLGLAPLGLLLR